MVGSVELLRTNDFLKDLVHIRCGSHVINLIVEEVLNEVDPLIAKIRYFAKKVNLYTSYKNFGFDKLYMIQLFKIHCSSKKRQDLTQLCLQNQEPNIVPS